MERKLGKTYIQTVVEIKTKKVNGEQRYRKQMEWAQVPHELLHPEIVRVLKHMAKNSTAGAYVEHGFPIYPECAVVEADQDIRQASAPRIYVIRGIIEQHIFITSKGK